MIKLYKRDFNNLLYWEAWENDGVYFIHWGEVGSKGNNREVRNSFLRKAFSIVSKEEKAKRVEGYSEIEDLQTVMIQYKIVGFGNRNDLDKRYKVEELMNECLGWTGLGHCDGGDIGSGAINIFCLINQQFRYRRINYTVYF